jgi:hypothetical protein
MNYRIFGMMINQGGDNMKKCCHSFIDTGKNSIHYNPETTTYFEDILKNSYSKTYCVGYNKEEYKILKCEYCGKEWEVLKHSYDAFIEDLLKDNDNETIKP